MFVRVKPLYEDFEGGIVIPDINQSAFSTYGVVEAVNPRAIDFKQLGTIPKVGTQVLIAPQIMTKRMPHDNALFIIPLAFRTTDSRGKKIWDVGVIAMAPKNVDLSSIVGTNERCKLCGPAVKSSQSGGQGVLMQNGRCPRCKRDRNGQLMSSSGMTDDEVKDQVRKMAMAQGHAPDKIKWDVKL